MALTKHKQGSIRELWCIAWPLMLSSLSVLSMIFVDRWLLAHYSTASLNAAVNATTLGWTFLLSWMVMTSIAEVFVAQYNGANETDKLGKPVWQMIWLSLLSILFFAPLSIWGPELIYGSSADRSMERDYFRWMLFFGPSYPIYSALCGFFIGQGKTGLVTSVAIITNIINAVLDLILIFGIEGYVPAYGIKGAAIATSLSAVCQAIILGSVFLSKHNQQNHGTGDYRLDWGLMRQCLKIGTPNACFIVLELSGWALFYTMMTSLSESHITIAGICQSILILFSFFGDGLNKAVIAIAGNFIGSNQPHYVKNLLKSGFKLHAIFFLLTLVVMFIFGDIFMEQFLPNTTDELYAELRDPLWICLLGSLVYLLMEGLRMLFGGALTAAGDTFFLLISGSLTIWLLMVAPVYFLIVKSEDTIEKAILIWVVYAASLCAIYGWRFAQGKWKDIPNLISDKEKA